MSRTSAKRPSFSAKRMHVPLVRRGAVALHRDEERKELACRSSFVDSQRKAQGGRPMLGRPRGRRSRQRSRQDTVVQVHRSAPVLGGRAPPTPAADRAIERLTILFDSSGAIPGRARGASLQGLRGRGRCGHAVTFCQRTPPAFHALPGRARRGPQRPLGTIPRNTRQSLHVPRTLPPGPAAPLCAG